MFADSVSFNDILRNLPDCIPENISHKLVQKNFDEVEALPTNQLLEGKTAGDNALMGIELLGHDSPKTECKCSAKKYLGVYVYCPQRRWIIFCALKDS